MKGTETMRINITMIDCEGCQGAHYRLATRGDGTHAVERCDTCSPNLSDNDAIELAGDLGKQWVSLS